MVKCSKSRINQMNQDIWSMEKCNRDNLERCSKNRLRLMNHDIRSRKKYSRNNMEMQQELTLLDEPGH